MKQAKALRERRRATALGRHIGSNEPNQRIRSSRTRSCPPAKPYIYSTYRPTSVLLLYCAHVHRFWQNKTDPANRQIWFVIQFTTSRLDDGDLKRLCHGRTKRFVPALDTGSMHQLQLRRTSGPLQRCIPGTSSRSSAVSRCVAEVGALRRTACTLLMGALYCSLFSSLPCPASAAPVRKGSGWPGPGTFRTCRRKRRISPAPQACTSP